jgi:CHAD domain-containing protein
MTLAAAGPFLARRLRAVDTELAAAIPRVIQRADDEAIHDLRVAIRRLRTLLKLARPVFGRFHADSVRAAFTAVHRATGALRDEEVLEETLASLECGDPAFTAWRTRRAARERSLRRAVIARLHGGELTLARKLLRALVTLPVSPKREVPAAKLARRAIDRARRGVERLRDTPTTDGVGLHTLRIAYKELRYAAELLADALPADLAAMAAPASRFQKRLGEVHDADVALVTITRARGLDPAVRADVLARLDALRARKIAKYVAEMAPTSEAAAPAEAPAPALTAAVASAVTSAVTEARAARKAGATKAAPARRASKKVTPSGSTRSGKSRPS